jgi:hypothetical protein
VVATGDGCELWRGHEITKVDGDTWVYAADNVPVKRDPNRPCAHCGKDNTPEGYDGCIGHVEGAVNACCGHGVETEAYVVLEDGTRIGGEEAVKLFAKARVKAKLAELREANANKLIPPVPTPRYDEVYVLGAQWLDMLNDDTV